MGMGVRYLVLVSESEERCVILTIGLQSFGIIIVFRVNSEATPL